MHIIKKSKITCIPHEPERLKTALNRYGYLISNNTAITTEQFAKLIAIHHSSSDEALEISKQLHELWQLFQNGLTPSELNKARSEGWTICFHNRTHLDFKPVSTDASENRTNSAYKTIKKGLLAQSSLHLKAYNLARVFNPDVAMEIARTKSK